MATKVKRGFKVIPVTTEDIGAVVVRGPDWEWDEQDYGALYGVIGKKASYTEGGWANVTWYNAGHMKVNRNSYRWEHYQDLAYYNPDDKHGIPGKTKTPTPKSTTDELPGGLYPAEFVQWIIDASKERIHFTGKTLTETYTLDVLYSIYKQEKQQP